MASTSSMPRFQFEAPGSVEQAAALLEQAGPEARVLAGGTDLLVKLKLGEVEPRLVVSLARIPDLAAVEPLAGGGLRVGSLATMAKLATTTHLSGAWAALADGAGSVGGPIIRNRATVGGNMVNARPCADTAPPLMAMGALLTLESTKGTRTVEADSFITGPGQTVIEPNEILTAIELPAISARVGSGYIKVTRRAAMEVTACGCAASLSFADDGSTVTRARVVLTSVAPVPLRVAEVESVLEGETLDDERIGKAAAAAGDAAAPIDDHRATAAYRSDVVPVITRRALLRAAERCGWRRP